MGYLNKENITKLKSLCKRYKPMELYYKIREKLAAPYQDYQQNLGKYLPSAEELQVQRQEQKSFAYRPLVSIVVPAYETEELFLKQLIDSCVAQTYPNWQLCIADGSRSDKVEKVLAREYGHESRISYQRLEKNAGISENTNRGFEMAEGNYIALLDHDDLLVPSALYEMVKRINETGAEFLYSDEDKVSADLSRYMEPHFKLDFNRELLLGNNYICHLLMVSGDVLKKAGGLDSRYDGAQDFDFVLRCSECTEKIEHISKILYHWRMHSGSTAGNTDSKLYAYEAGKRAVEDYLKRKGWQGEVSMTNDLGFYRILYQVPSGITVGIACWGEPSRRFEKILKQVKQELEQAHIEIVWEGEWEQKRKCQQKQGKIDREGEQNGHSIPEERPDFLIIMNRALTGITEGSVLRLLGSCAREDVGIVGSKTIRKGKVLQCGFREKEGKLEPRFAGLPRHFKGYFRRAYLPVEVDAVSFDLAVVDLAGCDPASMDISGHTAQSTEKRIIADPGAEVK